MERGEKGGAVVDVKVEGNDQLWSVRVVEIREKIKVNEK